MLEKEEETVAAGAAGRRRHNRRCLGHHRLRPKQPGLVSSAVWPPERCELGWFLFALELGRRLISIVAGLSSGLPGLQLTLDGHAADQILRSPALHFPCSRSGSNNSRGRQRGQRQRVSASRACERFPRALCGPRSGARRGFRGHVRPMRGSAAVGPGFHLWGPAVGPAPIFWVVQAVSGPSSGVGPNF